ncbi:MAG: hypothetical protein AABX05_02400 [Nanoarchaeota archaeon]
MPKYNTGCMPNTDFRYEEFEGLLGSFHLSLFPLRDSAKPEDQRDYQKVMEILNGFAQRYGVQSPEEAAKNPRARKYWGNAHVMKNWSTLDMMASFWKDFGVGAEPGTEDHREQYELRITILLVFDRYGIAQVGYEEHQGERLPVKVDYWNLEKSRKTLVDVLNE